MNIGSWFGQATTGTGFATVLAAFCALATGALNWHQAVPVLAGGVAGLIWPENPALKAAAQQAVADVGTVVTAYQVAGSNGAAPVAPASTVPVATGH
jgi:hypothetical protein